MGINFPIGNILIVFGKSQCIVISRMGFLWENDCLEHCNVFISGFFILIWGFISKLQICTHLELYSQSGNSSEFPNREYIPNWE